MLKLVNTDLRWYRDRLAAIAAFALVAMALAFALLPSPARAATVSCSGIDGTQGPLFFGPSSQSSSTLNPSPASGSNVSPGDTVYAVYHDETALLENDGQPSAGKQFSFKITGPQNADITPIFTTLDPRHTDANANGFNTQVPAHDDAWIPTSSNGGIHPDQEFNNVVKISGVIPNFTVAGLYTIRIETHDGDDNGSGGDCGFAQWNLNIKAAHIGVLKTADASPVSAGSGIGFVITTSNTGPGTALGVVMSDTLPTTAGTSWGIGAAGSDTSSNANCSISVGVLTCSYGTMAASTSHHVHIVSGTTSATGGLTVTNTASVTTSNDGSGVSTATIDVLAAHIGVLKVADASPVSAGSGIGFVITTSNTGAGTATGVVMTDPLPTTAGTSWSIDAAGSDASSNANCSISVGVLTCSYGTMAASTSHHVHIVSGTTSATGGLTVTNTASVTTSNDGSGVSTATIDIAAGGTLAASVVNPALPKAGAGLSHPGTSRSDIAMRIFLALMLVLAGVSVFAVQASFSPARNERD